MKIAILCIGNRLMLDDGVGPAVYDALEAGYRFGDDVALYDAGCMTMDLLPHVCKADFVIVVDAVDGTASSLARYFVSPRATSRATASCSRCTTCACPICSRLHRF